MSDVVRCDDVWCGENAIRPNQELLLCVLFFRLVMCDMVRCDVWCLVRCNDVWCVMWWDCVYPAHPAQALLPRTSSLCSLLSAIRPKNSAQELLLCVLFFRLVMCDMVRCDVWCLVRCNDVWCVMWWDCVYPAHPAQALLPRTSSLWSLLSAIRPKNSAKELLLCVLFFRLVMCDMVRCDVWCLVRCNDVWCVMWWDCVYPAHPAQALLPRTSSLWSLLSAIRPKNSAQELLLCVLFFRLVMCDMVRCDVWCLVRCNDVWCGEIASIRLIWPKHSAQELLLCVLLMSHIWWDAIMCDVWCGEISRIRPRNSARELLLCVLFFRLVMYAGQRFQAVVRPHTSIALVYLYDDCCWRRQMELCPASASRFVF